MRYILNIRSENRVIDKISIKFIKNNFKAWLSTGLGVFLLIGLPVMTYQNWQTRFYLSELVDQREQIINIIDSYVLQSSKLSIINNYETYLNYLETLLVNDDFSYQNGPLGDSVYIYFEATNLDEIPTSTDKFLLYPNVILEELVIFRNENSFDIELTIVYD